MLTQFSRGANRSRVYVCGMSARVVSECVCSLFLQKKDIHRATPFRQALQNGRKSWKKEGIYTWKKNKQCFCVLACQLGVQLMIRCMHCLYFYVEKVGKLMIKQASAWAPGSRMGHASPDHRHDQEKKKRKVFKLNHIISLLFFFYFSSVQIGLLFSDGSLCPKPRSHKPAMHYSDFFYKQNIGYI